MNLNNVLIMGIGASIGATIINCFLYNNVETPILAFCIFTAILIVIWSIGKIIEWLKPSSYTLDDLPVGYTIERNLLNEYKWVYNRGEKVSTDYYKIFTTLHEAVKSAIEWDSVAIRHKMRNDWKKVEKQDGQK